MIGKYEKKPEPPISVEPHLPDQKELNKMGGAYRRAASHPTPLTAEELEKQVQRAAERRVKPWRESAKAAAKKRAQLRKDALFNAFYAELVAFLLLTILIQLEAAPLIIAGLIAPVALVAAYWIGKSRRW